MVLQLTIVVGHIPAKLHLSDRLLARRQILAAVDCYEQQVDAEQ